MYKCHPKFTPGGAETATSAGGEGQEYEEVDGGKGGGKKWREHLVRKNEAYASTTHHAH